MANEWLEALTEARAKKDAKEQFKALAVTLGYDLCHELLVEAGVKKDRAPARCTGCGSTEHRVTTCSARTDDKMINDFLENWANKEFLLPKSGAISALAKKYEVSFVTAEKILKSHEKTKVYWQALPPDGT